MVTYTKIKRCKICNRKAVGLTRSINVCGNCFFLLKRDKRFVKHGDLKIVRYCVNCHSSFLGDITYRKTRNGLVLKIFCCKNCLNKNI